MGFQRLHISTGSVELLTGHDLRPGSQSHFNVIMMLNTQFS